MIKYSNTRRLGKKSGLVFFAPDVPVPDVLWWKMNDSGGVTIASANAGPTGTTNGTLGGGKLTLNGTSQAANSSTTIAYTTSIITAMGWFNATAYSTDATKQILLEDSVFVGGNVNRWAFYSADSVIYIYVTDNAGNAAIFSFVPPSNGVNNHIAVVLNNASAALPTAYINGAPVAVSTVLNTWASAGVYATDTLYCGSRAGTGSWFGGTIDDVRIYTTNIGAAAIAAIYAAGAQ